MRYHFSSLKLIFSFVDSIYRSDLRIYETEKKKEIVKILDFSRKETMISLHVVQMKV